MRSVSAESVEFVKAMKRSDLKDSDKLELLRKACTRHTLTNQDACDGLGTADPLSLRVPFRSLIQVSPQASIGIFSVFV